MSLPRTIGSQGETLARSYLESKGYIFVSANWSCKLGEIDLIMDWNGTRVFVEVRVRSNPNFGSGADSVNWHKQRRLLRATAYYQQRMNYWGDIRFDVVSINLSNPLAPTYDHIEYAFGLD